MLNFVLIIFISNRFNIKNFNKLIIMIFLPFKKNKLKIFKPFLYQVFLFDIDARNYLFPPYLQEILDVSLTMALSSAV